MISDLSKYIKVKKENVQENPGSRSEQNCYSKSCFIGTFFDNVKPKYALFRAWKISQGNQKFNFESFSLKFNEWISALADSLIQTAEIVEFEDGLWTRN